jgi:4-hydroxythreonine-4-phosphate dehydrogenase
VTSGVARAMTTAPVSKHVIATSGARGARGFLGHTEHLARQLGAKEVVMAFWSEKLVTSLVTTHVRLAKVPKAITPEGVSCAAYWLGRLLRDLGNKRPRIVVAALNPHAGESGLLGDEEPRLIEPGITLCRARFAADGIKVDLHGPLGAESAYRRTIAGDFDAVVAMYHDQATIPMKVLSFGDAVNVTLGLPIIRTSVDHGTAYDLAGKGIADADAMTAALSLAVRLTKSRRARAVSA